MLSRTMASRQAFTLPPQTPSPASDLRGTLVEGLAAKGVQRRYRAGALLIQEGDLGDTLYIILSGRLRAFAADNGGKEITLGVYGPGDYVGEMSLDGGPRSANVETVETAVCAVVTRETLRAYIAENPEFAFDLIARLIRRARMATESTRNLALIDVYGRLVRVLNQLATLQADGTRLIAERITHQEMAHRVACSREMVSRLLKDLESGGYIAVKDRRLVLLKTLPARW
ncbi:MAG TPA: Crp/Fnr family transcriptional regulator [Burkholderiaceae bacterium]|nr:Crp/Fnr family transcriptional regulator [Burkholderiaceae bacterium]